MEPRLSLVTLGVSDLGRSRRFYARMGWTESAASQDSVAFFQAGGVVLGLWDAAALAADSGLDFQPLPTFRGVALAHNVRDKAEVATVLDQAREAGATILVPARDVFWGGHSGCFADPDGHVWEVAWNPFFPLDADGIIRLE
jgi:uncharacterized glyoxalase superfamily protein PhnB